MNSIQKKRKYSIQLKAVFLSNEMYRQNLYYDLLKRSGLFIWNAGWVTFRPEDGGRPRRRVGPLRLPEREQGLQEGRADQHDGGDGLRGRGPGIKYLKIISNNHGLLIFVCRMGRCREPTFGLRARWPNHQVSCSLACRVGNFFTICYTPCGQKRDTCMHQ